MRIDLGDYILKSDSACFYIAVPVKTKNKETGAEETADQGKWFYSDFYQMIEGLARHKLLKSTATSLRELRDDLSKIQWEVAEIRKQFNDTEIKGKLSRKNDTTSN